MALPSTRQGLIDYALRKLGAGVIDINVDSDQVEDRVDDALQMYQDFHYDATEKVYLAHTLTSLDIAQQYIQLPDSILSVTRILPLNTFSNSKDFFSYGFQLRQEDAFALASGGSIVNYDLAQQHLALLQFELGIQPSINFSRHKNQLQIHIDWTNDVTVGTIVMIECFRILDPDSYTSVYSDKWLMAYTTALFKKQWADNLSKFAGVTMPGGIQLNGPELAQQAIAEIEKLEQQVQSQYTLPCDFFMG